MAGDTNNNGLRVPFGLKHGRLFPPQDTDRGLACDCICPGCGSNLIANQGKHKQPYFSHYQSRECSGGYESAVHLMAKQIIKDQKYIVIPEYQKTFSRKMPTGDVLKEQVQVRRKRLEFIDVRLEETVDGLRPDVIGVTHDGTEVFIEVYVTHSVTDDKRERFAKKNLFELDLSSLPTDLVSDKTLFAEQVLSKTEREWISCRVYHEEEKAAHQALNRRVARFISDHRSRVEQAKIKRQAEAERLRQERRQRQQDEAAAKKKKIEITERKSQLRKRFSRHLEQLQNQLFNPGHQAQEPQTEELQAIARRIGCVALPEVLAYTQNEDWIFKIHRSVWQTFIYENFILGKPRNILHANDVKRAVVREFGMLDWVTELINLKYQHKVQGRSRGQWYASKGVWFFSDIENRMIPSPYLLILNYLTILANEGLLILEHPGRDSFTVRFDSFSALEDYKIELAEKERQATIEKQKADLEKQKENEAQIRRLHQAQKERRQRDIESREQRITFLVALVDSEYVKKGITDVRRCTQCSHFQELVDGETCLECNCGTLWDVTLSASYLETLPHRLRCMSLFPRSR